MHQEGEARDGGAGPRVMCGLRLLKLGCFKKQCPHLINIAMHLKKPRKPRRDVERSKETTQGLPECAARPHLVASFDVLVSKLVCCSQSLALRTCTL